MVTTIDKAIAAIIGGFASFFALKFGFKADWLTPDMINSISLGISGLFAYLIPNKTA